MDDNDDAKLTTIKDVREQIEARTGGIHTSLDDVRRLMRERGLTAYERLTVGDVRRLAWAREKEYMAADGYHAEWSRS